MLFAIEEINNSTDILPGVSLGYKIYDACGSIAQSVKVALALANGNEGNFAPSQTRCSKPAQVQAIMGETSSSPCMAIATVIGPFHIPMVRKANNYLFKYVLASNSVYWYFLLLCWNTIIFPIR